MYIVHVLVVQSIYVIVQLHIHTCMYIVHTSGIHVVHMYHSAHACSNKCTYVLEHSCTYTVHVHRTRTCTCM